MTVRWCIECDKFPEFNCFRHSEEVVKISPSLRTLISNILNAIVIQGEDRIHQEIDNLFLMKSRKEEK